MLIGKEMMIKRVLVLTAAMLVALVCTVQAGPLSGDYEGAIAVTPRAFESGELVIDLTSRLAVNYTSYGWSVSANSTFTLAGLSKQVFSIFGTLGAFVLSSTITFDPLIAESITYTLAEGEAYQRQLVTGVTSTGVPTAWTKSIWNCAEYDRTITYGPAAFESWQASAQTSLWGVNFDWLFYLKGNDFAATSVSGEWIYGNPYIDWMSVQTQTGSYTASTCLPQYGFGSKFTLSALVSDVRVTSRTYFNLEEYSYNELMAQAHEKTHLADTLALGGSYYLPKVSGETYQIGFTREFITLEGMTLGCANVDLGLSFSRDGFDWLNILLTDIDIEGLPLLSFDTLVTFATQTKLIVVEPTIMFGANGCFTFHLALDWSLTGFSVNGLIINGFSMSYVWNGIAFASATSFNPVYESLGGYYLAAPVRSPTTYGFFVPDKYFSKDSFSVDIDCTASTGTGYYKQICFPEEYYEIWEKFSIQASSDGCCGGKTQWKVTAYFGHRKAMIADSFWFWYKDEDGNSYQYNAWTPATRTEPVVSDCEDDAVTYGVAYYDADGNTLFGLVKTDIDVIIPISTSIDLAFGTTIDVYGWEGLKLGLSLSW